MTDNQTYLTKDGYAKLKAELEVLVHTRRKEIASRIQEAKELGDLSENAEYQEAKNEQAFNEGRIEELENTLRHAQVIEDGRKSDGRVRVGSHLKAEVNGKTVELELVGSNEADPLVGRISNESPLGQVLLGKSAGDMVSVTTPKGQTAYTITSVS
ncbi:MAG: transcription elongation factor GreA [Candidatus Kerfeldbacteria bacterium]|nr:transcription elongation factor GreA [Candidatus Kerfeldbacteria bacterium]